MRVDGRMTLRPGTGIFLALLRKPPCFSGEKFGHSLGFSDWLLFPPSKPSADMA
jgi:hypothetical protein